MISFDALDLFVYKLIQDEFMVSKINKMVAGVIEDLPKITGEFSDPLILEHAHSLVEKMKTAGRDNLAKDLEKAFIESNEKIKKTVGYKCDPELDNAVEMKIQNLDSEVGGPIVLVGDVGALGKIEGFVEYKREPKNERPYFKCGCARDDERECDCKKRDKMTTELKDIFAVPDGKTLSDQIDDYIDEKLEKCENVVGKESDDDLVDDAGKTIDELLADGSINEEDAKFLRDELNGFVAEKDINDEENPEPKKNHEPVFERKSDMTS